MSESMEVLHLSTHNEECGIAIYQQNIIDAMGSHKTIHNVFFDISPNKLKLLKGTELTAALDKLFTQLKDFQILHIQMEYSFFADDQLQRIVDGAKLAGVKILFTLHTPPHARREHYQVVQRTLNPHSWLADIRTKRVKKRFLETYILPLYKADCLIVPSKAAKASFASYGVPRELLQVVELPVPRADTSSRSSEVAENLQKKPGDVILSMAGFIADTKGVIPLIRSLTFLPDNYKLAIIGGAHPSGQNDRFYDEVCNLIQELGLQKRVYITGYVISDARRDALLRETDICIYAYDRAYYDYVSSAALMNAVACGLPIIAYKTRTFEEANMAVPFISFCQSANYYEIARIVRIMDRRESAELTKKFARIFTVEKQAERFAEIYQRLTA